MQNIITVALGQEEATLIVEEKEVEEDTSQREKLKRQ